MLPCNALISSVKVWDNPWLLVARNLLQMVIVGDHVDFFVHVIFFIRGETIIGVHVHSSLMLRIGTLMDIIGHRQAIYP